MLEHQYAVDLLSVALARLDDMHNGIKDYLGGKLSFAPLENPKRILELGLVFFIGYRDYQS